MTTKYQIPNKLKSKHEHPNSKEFYIATQNCIIQSEVINRGLVVLLLPKHTKRKTAANQYNPNNPFIQSIVLLK